MSDYLTRAVESIRPEAAAIRPRLPTVFEPDTTAPVPTFSPTTPRREVERPVETEATSPLREPIRSVAEIMMHQSPRTQTPPDLTAKHPVPAQSPFEPSIKIVPEKSGGRAMPSSQETTRQDAPREIAEQPTAPPLPKLPPVTVLPRVARPPVAREITPAAPAIHVTIGRVEVRAITPAQAPPPKRRPRAAPRMSLDDYLRKRNGGQA